MVEIITIKPHGGPPRLVPATRDDYDVLESIRAEHGLKTVLTFERSNKHNRWYHKLVEVVADGCGLPPNWLKTELKARAGLYADIHTSPKCGVLASLKSTSFGAMDEIEFTAFRRVAVNILFSDFLPGVARKDVYQQVFDMLGESCPWTD